MVLRMKDSGIGMLFVNLAYEVLYSQRTMSTNYRQSNRI
jgi:hypothetical protein